MAKKKKNIFIFIVLTIITLGLVWLIFKPKNALANNTNTPTADTTDTTQQGNISGAGTTTSSYPLVLGSTGNNVKVLQNLLNARHGSGLTVDGIFGNNTLAALQAAIGRSQINSSYELVFI